MRRSAAGRAGGRPAADGPDVPGTRSGARLRAVVAPLLAALPLVMALVVAPAHAAPPSLEGTPVLTATPGNDDSTDPDRPVQIEVSRFEPRTVTPGATVTVAGTFTNSGTSTITALSVRLQRGDVLTSRAELAALGRDPDPTSAVLPPFQTVDGELAPGDELPFNYTVGATDLRIDDDGVYPVLLNVNGTVDGDQQRRVGELSTFVVQQPVVPTARTAVAWLWPLVEPTHRSASGAFVDDGLTDAVSTGGRLDRALTVIERLPGTGAPGATQSASAVPVTLAIDPALVEELTLMAAGPYAVDGVDGTGRGTGAAAAFLERLRAVAAVHPVVALPYGDVDADALTAAGLSDVLTRSLPGTPGGTAEDAAGSSDQAGAAPTSPAAGGTGTPTPEAKDADTGAGARILADALDVEPRTDLAWAAGGSLRPDTLATLQAGGVDQVVLGAHGLTDGEAAIGLTGATAAARTTVKTASGPLEVLVADPVLGEVAGAAERTAGGARIAEQRYLAELATLTLQAREGTEQTVLVAPPRDVEAGPEGAGAMMADTAGLLPWLRAGSTDELAAAPPAATGDLVDPVDAVRLDTAGLADVVEGVAVRNDLAGSVVGDADAALATYDAAIARTASATWRADPEGFRHAAAALRTSMERLRGRVTLLAPADGTYSLASSDAPLVLTVRNDLPFALQVRLAVRTRGNRGLSVADIGAQTLAPGERTTLQVPTEMHQSGAFAVTAQLTTPTGGPLGEQVRLQVKSTAYGPISLLITIGAAALLGLLFLRRLVRFVLRRRGTAATDAEPPAVAPEGTAVPPTRSPV